jgi:hypothetical protein
MNALPVGPQQVGDNEGRKRYFDDLESYGFDIAYNAYYAFDYQDVVGKFADSYKEFVAEAHRRGIPACIQIQSTVCAGDRIGIEEAQYNLDNQPEKWGERGFFASFASEAWKDYLKQLTTLFIKEFGFDYVVYEEPMYRVDIPGPKDRFYAKFTALHPNCKYPDRRAENTEYLMVQQAKADLLLAFYTDLIAHAKSSGAKKAGVMPWFFIPTIENTPAETLNTSCDINAIANIPGLDILVVRMQPDNIYFGTMRTGDEMSKSPKLYYVEVMAHALGKDVIAVNNPTDEHTDYPACPLIPYDFFREATLASLAAAPCGFTRHWYGQNYGKDQQHMELLANAAAYANRLGQPLSPVAFVFSSAGMWHAEPHTYEKNFQHYWALAKRMAFNAHIPMLTFHAETLEQQLLEHPEVQVLVFEEHFPLTVEQMSVIRSWWEGTHKRAVVAFGAGVGISADVNMPGGQPCGVAFPGVLELIGLRQEEVLQYVSDDPLPLRDVSRVRRSAFLEGLDFPAVRTVANVRRVFGSRANVLYELDVENQRIPVVAERRDRLTLAIFCGFGLNAETAPAAERAIRYAMRESDCPPLMIDSCSDGMLWNINANGYLVLANISPEKGTATGRPGRANFWNCRNRKQLPDGDPKIEFEPYSFQVYRVVGRRSKFLDIIGCSRLRKVIDGAGRAEISVWAGKKTTLVLRASPKEITVDGRFCTVTQEVVDGVYYVTLNECQPGERLIGLRW